MPPRMRRRITSTKREELEKQQRELAKTIVRPFEVLSGLPVSFSSPQANDQHALKNPLTVKDSGVFYRSLMKSRHTYVHICPMFTLYWIKQSSYAKKLAEQDKPLPKSAREETIMGRSPLLSGDISARDVMVKLCDASITLGPHDFEIRLFIAKDERSEKGNKKKEKEVKSLELSVDANKVPSSYNEVNNTSKIENTSDVSKIVPALPVQKKDDVSEADNTAETDNKTPSNNENVETEINDSSSDGQKETKINDEPKETIEENNDSNINDKNLTDVPKESAEPIDNTQAKPSSDVLSGPNSGNASTATTTSTPQPTTADANNMQSIENTIMISNLNTIARTDTSLNSLMKIVASGKASPQEIIKFQGYIKKAREMGPQPHHAYLFAQHPGYFPYGNNLQMMKGKKSKEKKPPKEKKLKSKIPKDQKLTAFQEKYLTDATILFEFVESANVRFIFPKDAICEVIEPEKKPDTNDEDQDITDVKDVLVSFLWIHNQAEIGEYEKKLAEYNKIKEEREQKENPNPEEKQLEEKQTAERQTEGKQTEDKQKEGKQTEDKQTEDKQTEDKQTEDKQKEEKNTDETVSNPSNEQQENPTANSNEINEGNETSALETSHVKNETNDEVSIDRTTKRTIPPRKNTRRRKYTAPKRNSIRKLELPIEPEKKFTAITFTIHNIPSRYVPIVTNSFSPPEKVQNYMSDVLKNGTRSPNFYLWYQVDGKLDEELAENIRIQLNQEEKKLTGISITNLSNSKKRTKKDKEPKPKKAKLDNDTLNIQSGPSTENQGNKLDETTNPPAVSEQSVKVEPLSLNMNITT